MLGRINIPENRCELVEEPALKRSEGTGTNNLSLLKQGKRSCAMRS